MKDQHEIMDASNYHNLYSQNMVGRRVCRESESFVDIVSCIRLSLLLPLPLPLHPLLITFHFPKPLPIPGDVLVVE